MVETGCYLNFPVEPLSTECCREFWTEDFYCHLAVELQVLGEVHRRHPPATELPLDGVAVGECSSKTALDFIGHFGRPRLVQKPKVHRNPLTSQNNAPHSGLIQR